MTEEDYGRAGTEAAQGFVPLPDSTPAPDPEREYAGHEDGLREAARDLNDAREESKPVIERKYTRNGEIDGPEVPANQTIEHKRAASDLTAIRSAEAFQAEAVDDQHFAEAIDHVRASTLNQQTPPVEQPAEQPTIQPEADLAPESGIDPDVQKALENPKFRQALETELQSVETARQQYAQAATQAAQVAAAAMYAGFPEISGLTTDQLPVALQVLAQHNPQRHAQITEHLNHTRALYSAAQQAQAQQQQSDAVRLQNFTEQQDRVFDESIKSVPAETVKQVKAEVFEIAEKEYGIGRKEFAHLYRTEPILRSAAFQRVIFDAARFHIIARGAAERTPPNVPSVQRPGVSRLIPSGSDETVAGARQAFSSNPNPKTAAALLRARRSAS